MEKQRKQGEEEETSNQPISTALFLLPLSNNLTSDGLIRDNVFLSILSSTFSYLLVDIIIIAFANRIHFLLAGGRKRSHASGFGLNCMEIKGTAKGSYVVVVFFFFNLSTVFF